MENSLEQGSAGNRPCADGRPEPRTYRLRSCCAGYPNDDPGLFVRKAKRGRSGVSCATTPRRLHGDADVAVGSGDVFVRPLGREAGISETTCDAASLARRLYKTQIVGTYRAGTPFGEFDEIECGDIRRAGIGLDGSDDPSRRVQGSGVAARGSSLPGGRPQLSSAGFGAPR